MNFFLAALCLMVGFSGFSAEFESSKNKFFGVGGWLQGRDCSGKELFWQHTEEIREAFLRKKDGKGMSLGKGMAIFSPDCKYFWFEEYGGSEVKIFDADTGVLSTKLLGLSPAWTGERALLCYSRLDSKYGLWCWNFLSKSEVKIAEVGDYQSCTPPGESVDWHPVQFVAPDRIVWVYPTAVSLRSGKVPMGFRPAVVLTIDLPRKKVLKREFTSLECD